MTRHLPAEDIGTGQAIRGPIISLTTAGGNGDVPIANLSSYSCSNGGVTLVVGIVGRTNGNLQDNSFQFSATPI